MKLLKKVVYTVCSGDLEKECDNFVQQKQLPEFKRNCPACGSKTKEVLGVNHIGIASILILLLIAAGGAYWQTQRVSSAAVDLVQQATTQAASAIDGTKGEPRVPVTAEKRAPSSVQPIVDAPAALRAIQEKLGQKDYAGALKIGEEVLKSQPEDTTILNNVGSAAMKMGDFSKAKTYLERAVGLKPNDPYLRYNLGCLEALAGRKEGAVIHLKKACQLGLAPANFRQDPDLASLAGYASFEDLVVNKKCQ